MCWTHCGDEQLKVFGLKRVLIVRVQVFKLLQQGGVVHLQSFRAETRLSLTSIAQETESNSAFHKPELGFYGNSQETPSYLMRTWNRLLSKRKVDSSVNRMNRTCDAAGS